MWIIVGLGNPGNTYSKTRHNLGFMVVDRMADILSFPSWKKKNDYLYSTHNVDETRLMLVKPLTYMNRSGQAVSDIIRYSPPFEEIVVVHDDLDLPVGAIRIRQKGLESEPKKWGSSSAVRLLRRLERTPGPNGWARCPVRCPVPARPVR